jgi:hypothetical protein
MAYVLSNGLLCMILMAMVSFHGWSHLTLLTLFDLDALLSLDMVLGGRFHDDTQDAEHYSEDVAHFMQSVAPFDDCTYPGAPPHTSWTLDIR